MRRFISATILVFALFGSISAQSLEWIDGSELNVCGHTIRNAENPYSRIDAKAYGFENNAIIRYSRYSSGLYIMFKTNSSQVAVDWTLVSPKLRFNMTPIVQLGVDLYVKQDGEWRFCSTGRVSANSNVTNYKKTLVRNMDNSEKEFMLYLPLWNEVSALKIGVDSDANIEAAPSPYRYRVVTYGTSTLHAASPSRPGIAPLARLSRMLGVDFVNFSYSGQGKMEPESAKVLADCQTDAIVCYCFGNTTPTEIEERIDSFVEQVVSAHPDKAIIFLPPFLYNPNNVDLVKREYSIKKRETIARKMAVLTKKYKNLYYIDIKDACGLDNEASIDNSHPNDLGFERILHSYGPEIAKILKKYGIKTIKR